MSRSGSIPSSGRWISASELAEYAYCPRSWWYHRHPPDGADMGSRPERDRGTAFHVRSLGATRRREDRAGGFAWIAAGSAALILLALVVLYLGR